MDPLTERKSIDKRPSPTKLVNTVKDKPTPRKILFQERSAASTTVKEEREESVAVEELAHTHKSKNLEKAKAAIGTDTPAPSLPLVVPPSLISKSHLNQTVFAEIADSRLDLEGDIGAVGRFNVDEKEELCLVDIKGQQYIGTQYDCATLMVVKFTKEEAIVESIGHSFLQMKPSRDVIAEMGGVVTEGFIGNDAYDFYEEDANAQVLLRSICFTILYLKTAPVTLTQRENFNSDDLMSPVQSAKLVKSNSKNSKKRSASNSTKKGRTSKYLFSCFDCASLIDHVYVFNVSIKAKK